MRLARGRRHFVLGGVLALAGLVLAVSPAPAQSAGEIIDEVLERQEQRLDGIQNSTMVWRHEEPSMSIRDTAYLEKRTVAGHAALLPVDTAGQQVGAGFVGRMYQEFGENARHEGTAEVNGHEAHVLVVDDPETLERWSREMFRPMFERGRATQEVTLREARAYIDTERSLLLKTRFVFEASRDGETFPVEAETVYEDYREEQDLLWAHRMVNRTVGLTGAMSPEELEKAREALRKMEEKMEKMSESRRKMMESFMGDRLEKWRKMVEAGTMETVTELVEVKVNQGPPGGS